MIYDLAFDHLGEWHVELTLFWWFSLSHFGFHSRFIPLHSGRALLSCVHLPFVFKSVLTSYKILKIKRWNATGNIISFSTFLSVPPSFFLLLATNVLPPLPPHSHSHTLCIFRFDIQLFMFTEFSWLFYLRLANNRTEFIRYARVHDIQT